MGGGQLDEDLSYVRFERAVADSEPLRDGGVGEALSHQSEDLPLAFGESVERAARRSRSHELSDDRRVDHALTIDHAS
jgi:hypothetical protein